MTCRHGISPRANIVKGMYADDWTRWHDEHERRRSAPHGLLAATGMYWLDATPERFPDAPGAWSVGADGAVTVRLDAGEQLTAGDGATITGEHDFGPVDEDGVTLAFGKEEATVEVATRGEGVIVRPRHPGHKLRVEYAGTPAFPPDEKWIVDARYVPLDQPDEIALPTVVEGLDGSDRAQGRVEFEIGGVPLALTVFAGAAEGTLTTLFSDRTAGVTTYPASRRLPIPRPSPDGTLRIDFNRATNLPCAYTDFATCTLAPPENRLPVAIEAGEQIPRARRAAD